MRLAGAMKQPRLCAMRHLIPLIALMALTACNSIPGKALVDTLETRDWRQVATEGDRERLRNWRPTFEKALNQARAGGHSADVDALGDIANVDAVLPFTPLPNGNFNCRIIKLGSPSGSLAFVDYPAFQCRVRAEQDLQGLAKLTGSQRPIGLLFPDDDVRQVFIGTLVLGDESRAMRYGADPDRDMIGALQRIDDNRWRLLMPQPRFESTMDILILTPTGD